VKGERLRTVKLRGQISQGLLLNLDNVIPETHSFGEDSDVSEYLNIKKWEKAIPAQLAGQVKGNFPTQIPKTDQERCQNLVKEIVAANEAGTKFEVTEKLEGSSMTVYKIDGEFGVCSRNLDLKRDENNSFWKVAIDLDLENKMSFSDNFAIQGELVGPGVQGNIYKLNELRFYVFDIYDIKDGVYMNPADRRDIISRMGLLHVPLLVANGSLYDTLGITDIPGLLKFAEGESILADNVEREGVVFKEVNGGFTFKAISNKYLLGEK
jgi:RNA ligase (TIGR02306 family)